ncbi:hypothetical protein B7494_g7910 [Chlorociboria aeruginascens]|nr:hypothetical protein B7494_g7910 [Chlorociboria aeruginascens]
MNLRRGLTEARMMPNTDCEAMQHAGKQLQQSPPALQTQACLLTKGTSPDFDVGQGADGNRDAGKQLQQSPPALQTQVCPVTKRTGTDFDMGQGVDGDRDNPEKRQRTVSPEKLLPLHSRSLLIERDASQGAKQGNVSLLPQKKAHPLSQVENAYSDQHVTLAAPDATPASHPASPPPSIPSQQHIVYTYIARNRSVLDFEDCGPRDLTAEEEALIPAVEDLATQEEMYTAIRGRSYMVPDLAASLVGQPSASEQSCLFEHTAIQAVSDIERLSQLEQADSIEGITVALQVHGMTGDTYVQHPNVNELLVEAGVHLNLNSLSASLEIRDVQKELVEFYEDDESAYRRMFWESLIFKGPTQKRMQDGGKPRVIQIGKQRIQTVAIMKRAQAKREEDSIFPDGALPYYPLNIVNTRQDSHMELANGYIWMDLGYAVEANDILAMFSHDQVRLGRLPVNRMFWKAKPDGQRKGKFHYLNHLLIQVEPSKFSAKSVDLMLKAVGYLVLNAAACLHDYMKLLWLAAPRGSTKFQGDLPVIYLIAAVGFTAKVFGMHIRPFDEHKPGITGIGYEAVEMGTFDLTKRNQQKQFSDLYNSIQALAHHYAALHKKVMIEAMHSERDITTTELPDLSFVHFMENGELYFKMVDGNGVVQHEGLQEVISDQLRKEMVSFLIFNKDLYGELPKPDPLECDH